ncbi:hypothetical protein RB213_005720 [Colletotrichum asianum]
MRRDAEDASLAARHEAAKRRSEYFRCRPAKTVTLTVASAGHLAIVVDMVRMAGGAPRTHAEQVCQGPSELPEVCFHWYCISTLRSFGHLDLRYTCRHGAILSARLPRIGSRAASSAIVIGVRPTWSIDFSVPSTNPISPPVESH